MLQLRGKSIFCRFPPKSSLTTLTTVVRTIATELTQEVINARLVHTVSGEFEALEVDHDSAHAVVKKDLTVLILKAVSCVCYIGHF